MVIHSLFQSLKLCLFDDGKFLVLLKVSPLKSGHLENSLVVQWLRLCTPIAGGQGSIRIQGTRSHMPQLRPYATK